MRTGTDFHGLELLTFCGSGALGEVYRCRDLSGKILAVKIIPKQKLGGEWRRELKGVTYYRSLTENSPELLQIHHIGEDEENFFYTMDAADNAVLDGDSYVPDTLAYRLRSGRIPPLRSSGSRAIFLRACPSSTPPASSTATSNRKISCL